MTAKRSTKHDHVVFKKWSQFDRLEELTCRPVVKGKRISKSNEVHYLSFFTGKDEKPAGKFMYFDINTRNKSCEFGYVIDPVRRNTGLGKKMLAECINYLFKNTDLNKIYCQTASFNTPSVKLLEGLGFKRDGILRRHHELDGKLWDDYIYSVLRSEWKYKKGNKKY